MSGGTLSRYQPHPLSRSPFHAFNVVLVSCGHFRSHFGQNVIVHYQCQWSAIDPIVFYFNICVFIYARSHRQTRMLTRRSQNHNIILVRSYNKTMDGLVIKKKIVLSFWKKKKIVLSFGQKKKIVLRGKNPDPPLVMKWEAPKAMICIAEPTPIAT